MSFFDGGFFARFGGSGGVGSRGLPGKNGVNGWSPEPALVAHGDGYVIQITDWEGGGGTKPATDRYVGQAGLVTDIDQAVVLDIEADAEIADGSIEKAKLVQALQDLIDGKADQTDLDSEADMRASADRGLVTSIANLGTRIDGLSPQLQLRFQNDTLQQSVDGGTTWMDLLSTSSSGGGGGQPPAGDELTIRWGRQATLPTTQAEVDALSDSEATTTLTAQVSYPAGTLNDYFIIAVPTGYEITHINNTAFNNVDEIDGFTHESTLNLYYLSNLRAAANAVYNITIAESE